MDLATIRSAWECGLLTGDEAWALVQIASLCEHSKTGECWASNDWFAAHGPGGERTAKRRIAGLIAKGWVASNQKPGGNRLLSVNLVPEDARKALMEYKKKGGQKCHPVTKLSREGGQNCPERGDKIVPSHNTIRETTRDDGVADASATSSKKLVLGSSSRGDYTPAHPVQQCDLDWSRKLHDAIVSAGHALPRPYPGKPIQWKKWASDFRKLREDGMEEQRISSVLEMFCQKITDPYAPQAWCGKSFRAKFASVERFCVIAQRNAPRSEEEVPEEVKALRSLNWKIVPSDADLIQSVDACRVFWERVQEILDGKKGQMWVQFSKRVRKLLTKDPILGWHRIVASESSEWSNWSGSLRPFFCRAKSDFVRKWLRSVSHELFYSHAKADSVLRAVAEMEAGA